MVNFKTLDLRLGLISIALCRDPKKEFERLVGRALRKTLAELRPKVDERRP